MKKIVLGCLSAALLAGTAYADVTLKVDPSVAKPVTFHLAVMAQGVPTAHLPPAKVSSGQSTTIDIRGSYGQQLSAFRGKNPSVSVSAGKYHVTLSGSPGSDHTVTYTKTGLTSD